MGDIGSAIGGMFGGGGAAASAGAGLTDADFAGLTDADIMGSGAADASSGLGSLFGGSSGGLSQFAQAMSALTGGGSSGSSGAAAGGGSAASDPASIPAPASAGGGVTATGGQQSGTQPGETPQQGQPGGSAGDQPPRSALDELRKLLQGGPKPAAGATADPFKTGAGAGSQQPPWFKPLESGPLPPRETPPAPASAGLPQSAPAPGEQSSATTPPPAKAGVPPWFSPAPDEPAAAPAAPAVPAAPGIEGLPPAGDPATLIPSGIGGFGRGIGLPGLIGNILRSTPAETGALPQGVGSNVGLEYSPASGGGMPAPQNEPGEQAVGSQPAAPAAPAATPIGGGAGNVQEAPTGTAVTKAPATGKPIKTVDPKTGQPVDPKTGDPLPTKVPTKKPGASPAPATAAPPAATPPAGGAPPGSLMGDLLGGSANPSTLLQLASIALPLIMGAMGGGGGRGGGWRHRGGGFGRFGGFRGGMNAMRGGGHGPLPAFRGGNLPAGHYPNRSGGFHWHPGGWHDGWHGHPNWGGQGGGGGTDPSQILSALTGQGGGGSSGGAGASGNYSGPGSGSTSSGASVTGDGGAGGGDFLATLVGQESGGQNDIVSRTDKDDSGRTLAQGGNPDQISQGRYQIRPSTWRRYAAQAGVDPNILPRNADPATQWKVASVIPIGQWGPDTIALLQRKFGNFDKHMPLGQVVAQFGGTGGGGTRVAAAPAAAPAQPARSWAGPDTASPIT